MVKFIKLALFSAAQLVHAGLTNNPVLCPEGITEGDACPEGGYCIHEQGGEWYCAKLARKWSKVMKGTKDQATILQEGLERSADDEDPDTPEHRNTYTWCAIPTEGVIYKEAPLNLQPIVEKCTHNPSGNVGDESRISNSTVGVNKEVCKLRCPDHRMDPMFVKKDTKMDNRVFQVTCLCQEGPKGPGLCGWKTTGSGTKEFAGGNLMCRYTHFAVKPILAPSDYIHPEDLDILSNWASGKNKVTYSFDHANFEVVYVTQERYRDDKGKMKTKYIDMDPNQHQYYENNKNNKIGTGLQMFPTDLIIENEAGKNDNQPNKQHKAVNVRAIVKCKAHDDNRFFFILYPNCKNKRHVLKKGRPGTCGWRIAEIQPNPVASFDDSSLGYDTTYPVPKPQKYTGKVKGAGLRGKSANGAVSALQKASKQWRCPDFVEKKV